MVITKKNEKKKSNSQTQTSSLQPLEEDEGGSEGHEENGFYSGGERERERVKKMGG